MECLSRPYPFEFKGCLTQILLNPFLHILYHLMMLNCMSLPHQLFGKLGNSSFYDSLKE